MLRLVEGVSGSVELQMELAPRPEYGLVRPLFRMEDDGGRTFGGPNQIAVSSGVPAVIEDATMHATFTVSEGERVGFALRWAAAAAIARSPARPRRSPPASTTSSRAGAPGRPSTTSTTARARSSCSSARAC